MKLALEICMHVSCPCPFRLPFRYIYIFLSYYQPHSIGIFIFAYFTFHLAIWGTAKRVISMHFNYCGAKVLALLNVTHTPCVTMIFAVCSHFLNCFLPTLCGISFQHPLPFSFFLLYLSRSLAIPLHIHYAGFCGHPHNLRLAVWVSFRAYNQHCHSRLFPGMSTSECVSERVCFYGNFFHSVFLFNHQKLR